MNGRTFFDTNVLVYRFDADEPLKQSRARDLLDTEGRRGTLVLSAQVLQEFYVSVTRKLKKPLSGQDAWEATRHLMVFHVVQVDIELISRAVSFSQAHQVSFWDALVIQTALQAGCRRLLSEDLQDGRVIDHLEIINPFRDLKQSKKR
jgi:predicted nucleic acid-binding protein